MEKTIGNREVIQNLREHLRSNEDVTLAILFGSVAGKGVSCHDVDIAVKLAEQKRGLLALGELVYGMAKALGVGEERIDIVDVDQAPVHLLWRILRGGIVVKADEEVLRQLHEKAKDYPDLVLEARRWINLDPEPEVDKMMVEVRVAEVKRNAEFLRGEILSKRPERLNYGDVLALERAIHRIAEAMLDVCRHLVAVHSLGLAESYGEYPQKLASAGRMPKDLAAKLSRLAGLRNIIVHRYSELKLELLYEASEEVIGEITKQFMEWLRGIDP